jgi:VIT1/CCC1 family predicted Fe2+/Mn2+ transporter
LFERFYMRHGENHRVQHLGWLRAAVLGANDGIISTASLMMGIAAAQTSNDAVLLAGVAGLVAGAVSMAAGEYVSVRSQADTEAADIERETQELAAYPAAELRELTEIYISRGLNRELAHQVAVKLTAHDALLSHARDELGIVEFLQARPLQAALTSAATFAIGAAIPLLAVIFIAENYIISGVAICSLIALALLGGLAAKVGGASIIKGAARVCIWGALAMALTGIAGHFFGVQL